MIQDLQLGRPATSLWFVISGEPIAKERPRFAGRRTFTPKKTADSQQRIQWELRAMFPRLKSDGDHQWGVRALFYCLKPEQRDGDNMFKHILDSLQGEAGIWMNDRQVKEGYFRVLSAKFCTENTPQVGRPRTEVLAYYLES